MTSTQEPVTDARATSAINDHADLLKLCWDTARASRCIKQCCRGTRTLRRHGPRSKIAKLSETYMFCFGTLASSPPRLVIGRLCEMEPVNCREINPLILNCETLLSTQEPQAPFTKEERDIIRFYARLLTSRVPEESAR